MVVVFEMATPAFWRRVRDEVLFSTVNPAVACWKFAEMTADLYLSVGFTDSEIVGHEAPPLPISLNR